MVMVELGCVIVVGSSILVVVAMIVGEALALPIVVVASVVKVAVLCCIVCGVSCMAGQILL